jgi:hypothetical protein
MGRGREMGDRRGVMYGNGNVWRSYIVYVLLDEDIPNCFLGVAIYLDICLWSKGCRCIERRHLVPPGKFQSVHMRHEECKHDLIVSTIAHSASKKTWM